MASSILASLSSTSSSISSIPSLQKEIQTVTLLNYGDVKRDLFVDVNKYDEYASKYTCSVCLVMKPMLYTTTECFHVLCESCADSLPSSLCPKCREPLRQPRVTHVGLITREISTGLALSCRWSSSSNGDGEGESGGGGGGGCKEVVEFGKWLDHVNRTCVYKPRECVECSSVVTERFFLRHQMLECKARFVDCDSCPQRQLHKNELQTHKTGVCPGTVLYCMFGKYGCTFSGKRGSISMDHHHSDKAKEHLDFVDGFVARLNKRFLENAIQLPPPPPPLLQLSSSSSLSSKRQRPNTVVSSAPLLFASSPTITRPQTEAEQRWKLLDSILDIPFPSSCPHVLVADSKNQWYIASIQKRVHTISSSPSSFPSPPHPSSFNDHISVEFLGFSDSANETVATMSGRVRPLFSTRQAQVDFYTNLNVHSQVDIRIRDLPVGHFNWIWAQGVVTRHSFNCIVIKITKRPDGDDRVQQTEPLCLDAVTIQWRCAPFNSVYGLERYCPQLHEPRSLP